MAHNEDMKQILQEAPDLSELKRIYGLDDVSKLLGSLPNSMYVAEQAVMEAERKLAKIKFELKQKTAQAHLKARNNPDLTSADDRKAWATTQIEVIEAELAVIEADAELSQAKLMFNRLERFFIAARKLASLLVDADQRIDDVTKYNQPETI